MTEVGYCNMESSLKELGFEGSILDSMSALVQTESDLEALESFIISRSWLTTNLRILNEFRLFKQSQDVITMEAFTDAYNRSVSLYEKEKCLEWLLKGNIERRWVEELDEKIDSGDTTLANFFLAFKQEPTLHIRKLILESTIETQGLGW